MNLFVPSFFLVFLHLFLAYCSVCVLGHLIYFSFRQKENNEMLSFKALIVAVIIVVTIFSILYSHGNSIFLISLFLLLIVLVCVIKKSDLQWKVNNLFHIEWPIFFRNLLFLFCIYSVAFYFFYIHNNSIIDCDNQFYANVAARMLATGIESSNIDWTILSSASPYHYFELWLISLVSIIFNIGTLQSYYLIFIPLSGVIIFQGAIALFECISKKEKTKIILPVLWGCIMLFVQGFFNVLLGNYFAVNSFIYAPKVSIVFIIVILFAAYIIQKRYLTAIFILMFLVPCYTPVAPGILCGSFILLCFYKITKQISIADFLRFLILIVVVPLLFFLFYYFQKNEMVQTIHPFITFKESLIKVTKDIFKCIFLAIIPNALVLLLLFIFLKKNAIHQLKTIYRKNKLRIISFVVFFIGGLFGLSVFIPVYFMFDHDALQLLSFFVNPLLCVCIFISLLIILGRIKKKMLFSLFLLTVFLSISYLRPSRFFNMSTEAYAENTYDKEYYEEIIKLIDPSQQFAYMRNYINRNPMLLKPFLLVPDNRLMHVLGFYVPQPLSIFDIQPGYDERYLRVENIALFKYVEKLKKDKNYKDVDCAIFSFLREYKIKYIIVEPHVQIPKAIKEKAKRMVLNKVNGNAFLVLD